MLARNAPYLCFVFAAACVDVPPLEDVTADASVQAIGAPGDPNGSNRCASVCTSSASCTQACLTLDNAGSSCARYGICAQACSSSTRCSSATSCSTSCYAQSGAQIDCGQAGTCVSCASTCSAQSSCDLRCDNGPSSTTCGGYGVCIAKPACSASVCNGGGTCATRCMHDGVEKRCDEWSHATRNDADLDGLPDALERALARRFAPTLHLRNSSYNGSLQGDLGQLYGVGHVADNPGSEWPVRVRPVRPSMDTSGEFHGIPFGEILSCGDSYQCIEIVYVLPYNWDLGDDLGWGWQTSHRGDGEMYAILVTRKDPLQWVAGEWKTPRWNVPWSTAQNDASAWTGFTEFVSAHMCAPLTPWGEYSDGSRARDIRLSPARPMGDGTHLWVAEGKHANYFSESACDGGGVCDLGGCSDDCSDNYFVLDPAVEFRGGDGPMRNAGEEWCHAHPTIDATITNPGGGKNSEPFGVYDVWSDVPFGDDVEGRPLVLLGRTLTWWQGSGYRCW